MAEASKATSVTPRRSGPNVPSRIPTAWVAAVVLLWVLVFCGSASTTTTTSAFVLPAPSSSACAAFQTSTAPPCQSTMTNNNRHHHHYRKSSVVRRGMSRSPSDDDPEQDSSTITTTTSTTTTSDPDLVDAIFKGKRQISTSTATTTGDDNENENESAPRLLSNRIETFLDKPFFDPDSYEDDDDSFFGKFASFVKNDYELFEAIFVACFFLLLLSVAKDVLRAQLVASTVSSSGQLF